MRMTPANKILYVTYCSAEKRLAVGEIAAVRRYKSQRIDEVFERAQANDVGFAILSGKYGLIDGQRTIPYYDHLLQMEEIETITKKSIAFLEENDWENVVFFTRPLEEFPKLKPYHEVMIRSCEQTAINLSIRAYP